MNPKSDYSHDFENWLGALRAACGQFEAKAPQTHSLFLGDILLQNISGLQLTKIRTNAQRITCNSVRNSTKTDYIDDSSCFLVIQRSGHSQLIQGGVGFAMAPSDLAFMDAAYGCEIIPDGLMEHVSIHLNRRHLSTLLPTGKTRIAKLSRNSLSGRLLHILANEICFNSTLQDTALDDGLAVQQALLNLLIPALKDDNEDSSGRQERILENDLLLQAKSIINTSLTDLQLTPFSIARKLQISVRQLYRLFEQSNDSVCRYIQRMRLSCAAKDLRNPRMQNRSLTDIAYDWGFSDSAHFSRSFKKQFDISPREYRHQC